MASDNWAFVFREGSSIAFAERCDSCLDYGTHSDPYYACDCIVYKYNDILAVLWKSNLTNRNNYLHFTETINTVLLCCSLFQLVTTTSFTKRTPIHSPSYAWAKIATIVSHMRRACTYAELVELCVCICCDHYAVCRRPPKKAIGSCHFAEAFLNIGYQHGFDYNVNGPSCLLYGRCLSE